jgi:hypothetical protein
MREKEKIQPTPEQLRRIHKASRLFVGTANFLRWTTNFDLNSVTQHPRNPGIALLSPAMSSRFAFEVRDDELWLGVQQFEMAWAGIIPWDRCSISDRIYLDADSSHCMDLRMPQLTIGLFVDDPRKMTRISGLKKVQLALMEMHQGAPYTVKPIGNRIPLIFKDAVSVLTEKQEADRVSLDHSKFF